MAHFNDVPWLSDVVFLYHILLELFKFLSLCLVLLVILVLHIFWDLIVAAKQVVAALDVEGSLSRRLIYCSIEEFTVIVIRNLIKARDVCKEGEPTRVHIEGQCSCLVEHELVVW